jgi:hypothetical protein
MLAGLEEVQLVPVVSVLAGVGHEHRGDRSGQRQHGPQGQRRQVRTGLGSVSRGCGLDGEHDARDGPGAVPADSHFPPIWSWDRKTAGIAVRAAERRRVIAFPEPGKSFTGVILMPTRDPEPAPNSTLTCEITSDLRKSDRQLPVRHRNDVRLSGLPQAVRIFMTGPRCGRIWRQSRDCPTGEVKAW